MTRYFLTVDDEPSVEAMYGETECFGGDGPDFVSRGKRASAASTCSGEMQGIGRTQGNCRENVDQVTSCGIVIQGNRLNLPGAAAHMPVKFGQCALFEHSVDLSGTLAPCQQAAEFDQRQGRGCRCTLTISPVENL